MDSKQNPRLSVILGLNNILGGSRKPKEVIEEMSLSRRDRAFAMELLYGSIRYRDTLNWVLDKFLRNSSGLSQFTINNLRCGAYQILFMRVPEWAAVNEAVRIERSKPNLVNAVLRNIARKKDALQAELKEMRLSLLNKSMPKSAEIMATITSHPLWLIKRWVKWFGTQEALALSEANNQVPPLTLRINTIRTDRDSVLKILKDKGVSALPTKYSPVGITLRDIHNYRELLGIAPDLRGLIYAQDEAAQLISYMLEVRANERVLDACSAPGGKATHIAELMSDRGEIIAVDNDPERLSILRENIETGGFKSIKIIMQDATTLAEELGRFDRILLDAPCTALGTIRRNPDIRYRYKKKDLLSFHEKQSLLLENTSKLLKRGGVLVYCTCSTEPEEGEQVVERFLKRHGDFYIIEKPLFGGLSKNGYLRTYPHRDGMDGFFGVRIARR